MKKITDAQVTKAREQLGAAFRKEMEEQGVSIRDLGEAASTSTQQVGFARNGERKYSIDTFIRMWLSLGLRMPDPKSHRRT